ncbi:MAG TPA: hypothetical protein VLD18_08330, partial [Verrucomicrobiae bacterium]|nr:hypothetical protein [Verrucomicrobiae bacterium]
MSCFVNNRRCAVAGCLAAALLFALTNPVPAQDLSERWGTGDREREYYRIVDVPIPAGLVIEAGAFETLPDGRIAVGTRHGEVYFISGIDAPKPEPEYQLFTAGLDEIFGLAWKDG